MHKEHEKKHESDERRGEHEDLWGERDRTLPREEWDCASEGAEDPEELFKAGLYLLKRDRLQEALAAFKKALYIRDREPRYMSYAGLALALNGKTKEAVLLCEKALQKESFRQEFFLNMGRVYLIYGNRRKALMTFRKGMALDRENRQIRGELERMGIRKPPVFRFLDRNHPVNKWSGKMLHRLRLR